MLITPNTFRFLLFTWGTIILPGSGFTAEAQPLQQQFKNPCQAVPGASTEEGVAWPADRDEWTPRPIKTNGLTRTDDGMIVYDANQGLCWLADANLAGDPKIRSQLGVAGINPNGTMDYPTALNWVDALNQYDGGRGYLGHNNWQLPVTPMNDDTCS